MYVPRDKFLWVGAFALCSMFLFAQSPLPVHLGFADSRPAIYTPLHAGMVITLSDVRYDEFGLLASFTEEIRWKSNWQTKLKIMPISDPKHFAKYTAEWDGKTIESGTVEQWRTRDVAPAIGFSPSNGVVILRAPGELQLKIKSTLEHDSFGRTNVASQEFEDHGTSYSVTYSSHTRDAWGRLSGFVASVETGLE